MLDIFEVIAIVIIFISMRDSFFQSSEMIMTGSTGQRSTTNYVVILISWLNSVECWLLCSKTDMNTFTVCNTVNF